jgi:glycosyltransferase involved in cell wall biosynthesis
MSQNLLFVLEFGETVPSGILRGTLYKHELQKLNIKVKYVNRNNSYLVRKMIMNKEKNIFYIVLNILSRSVSSFWILMLSFFYDSIWLNKVLSSKFIRILRFFNPHKIINLDIVDNPYENNIQWVESLKCVSSLTTDNIYNKTILEKYSNKVFVLPDYPLLDKFVNFSKPDFKHNFIFGWIGSKSSYYLLDSIKTDIINFLNDYPDSTFYLLGCPENNEFVSLPNARIVSFYDERVMLEVLSEIKVGLFPLDNTVASKVRGVLKATLYMASYTVVVSNSIGEIVDLIDNEINGIILDNNNQWYEKLIFLKNNPDVCDDISVNARDFVFNEYCLSSNVSKILKIVNLN